MRFSIIIPAYMEGGVGALAETLLSERLPMGTQLEKIIVVECECDDKSLYKVEERSRKVVVLKERKRRGKASAINYALSRTGSEIIVMESADTTPKKGTVAKLLKPFSDPRVGMTVGRPVPLDDRRSFVGYLSHVVWGMHHIVSSKHPKGGEMIAFRRTFASMPSDIVADESYVEYSVRNSGYTVTYSPGAVVYNKGPSSLANFVKQRRRVFSGHVQMKDELGYEVSTMDPLRVAHAALDYAASGGVTNVMEALWFTAAMAIEAWARIAGVIDFRLSKNVPYKWEMTR